MLVAARNLNTAYAFFERNWNLTRRYFGWEVVWFVYSCQRADDSVHRRGHRAHHRSDGRHPLLRVVPADRTTMWSYLSAVFDVVAETIAWERWEGTIEYTLMAPVPRFSTCWARAATR